MADVLELYDLRTNHMDHPIIDGVPCFSWKLKSSNKNVIQKNYRITVHSQGETIWDSGNISSVRQSFISYEGPALQSRRHYLWSVTVMDNHDETASAEAWFDTGLLNAKDWKAKWISCPFTRPKVEFKGFGNSHPSVIFRQNITISRSVVSARLYATAYGVYQASINGKRPDDREFAPEFTTYDKTLYYQTYDVTSLLIPGHNTLSFHVADGWYFSPVATPVMEKRQKEPAVLFQLDVQYINGELETFCSNNSATCSIGPLSYSDIFQGEKIDYLAEEQEASPVKIIFPGYENLMAQPMLPVRPVMKIPAKDVFTSPAGETIVDFGQNIAGWALIHLDVPKGQQVTFEYFEILDSNGNYINTMFAPQKDIVISDGKPHDYEANFTFHGFRYIRVSGMDEVKPENFTAIVLSTEKQNLGSFSCSDEKLNRLYKNIRWSQTGNMMSVPTDCPTREKGAYTGDLLLYCPTALLNEEMTPFLTSWLHGVRTNQREDGVVMITAPYTVLYQRVIQNAAAQFGDNQETGVSGWSDAIVWVPYDMYRMTGNTRILRENYEAMKHWCQYILKTAKEKTGSKGIDPEYDQYLWNTGFQFGEWLIPSQKIDPAKPYENAKTNSYYTAPFYSFRTIQHMKEISRVLGEKADELYFQEAEENIKNAIREGLIRAGKLPDKLMGAYVLAIAFDLVPNDLLPEFHEKLVKLIHKNGNRLDTGFLATPFLLEALCKVGEEDLAVTLLLQEKRPSWLYEVDHGATTIWEAWDADDAANGGRFVSYNHYAFGCVDEWIFKRLCGITPNEPGFHHFTIAPLTTSALTSCKRSYLCEAGEIRVSWNTNNLSITIPCNTTATVCWKGKKLVLGSGKYIL